MDMSEDDEEEGQVSKSEHEDEKGRHTGSEDDTFDLEDLDKCRLTREVLVSNSAKPWFEELVRGSYRCLLPALF